VPDEQNPEGFEIDGKTYAVPTIDTFDIAEARILKRYSGVVLEDFAPPHPEASDREVAAHARKMESLLFDPDFKAAFAHIAYRRGNLERDFEEIQGIVEKLSLVDVTMVLFAEDDAGPPEMMDSPSEPESENDSSSPSSSSDSGSPSSSDSGPRVRSLRPTGTSESDTSSPALRAGM
jgi:hypothetical protein